MDLEKIVKFSESDKYQYPDIFDIDCGVGIKWTTKDGLKLHTERIKRKNRIAELEISTWRGISFGAVHYYGKINVDGVNLVYDENPSCGTMCFEMRDTYPLSGYIYELILKREVIKEMIEEDGEMWKYYHPGSLTDRFDSIEDILKLAKEVFENRFTGGWKFRVSGPWKSLSGDFLEVYNRIVKVG